MLSMQSSQKLNELFAYLHMCGLVPSLTLFPLVRYSPIRGQPAPLKTEI